jgi:hypothetical protein
MRKLAFERSGLEIRLLEKRRFSSDLFVDVPGNRPSPPRDEPGQRSTQQSRKRQNCRIVEQVYEERFDGRERIRTAEIEQHDGEFQCVLRTRPMNRATCSTGVSGSTPCPRFAINGVLRVAASRRSIS